MATVLSRQPPGTQHESQRRCWDNAVAESFFSSLKKECVKKHIDQNRELAITDIGLCIDGFYNCARRHSYLRALGPEQFEASHKSPNYCLH